MATSAISAETSARPAAWPRALLLIGRVALGVVFLVAAYTKLHFNGAWHSVTIGGFVIAKRKGAVSS